MFKHISDKWKAALAAGGVLAAFGAAAGVGYKANAIEASKVDVSVFELFAKDIEKRTTTNEVTVKFVLDDLRLLKEQSRQTAMTVGAKIVIPPPDGGMK